MNFLYTAYAVVWLIHAGYIGMILRRYSRLQREMEDLKLK